MPPVPVNNRRAWTMLSSRSRQEGMASGRWPAMFFHTQEMDQTPKAGYGPDRQSPGGHSPPPMQAQSGAVGVGSGDRAL